MAEGFRSLGRIVENSLLDSWHMRLGLARVMMYLLFGLSTGITALGLADQDGMIGPLSIKFAGSQVPIEREMVWGIAMGVSFLVGVFILFGYLSHSTHATIPFEESKAARGYQLIAIGTTIALSLVLVTYLFLAPLSDEQTGYDMWAYLLVVTVCLLIISNGVLLVIGSEQNASANKGGYVYRWGVTFNCPHCKKGLDPHQIPWRRERRFLCPQCSKTIVS